MAQPASAAAILVNANGQLIGATGVNVQGTLYDVSVTDESCVTVTTVAMRSAIFFTTQAQLLPHHKHCSIKCS